MRVHAVKTLSWSKAALNFGITNPIRSLIISRGASPPREVIRDLSGGERNSCGGRSDSQFYYSRRKIPGVPGFVRSLSKSVELSP